MSKVQMTLYEAISKLKIYEDRLKKFDLNNKILFGYYTEANPTINGTPIKDVESIIQSNCDSFYSLRQNVYSLRAVVYEANIKNTITIPGFNNGEPITLAEAVSRYNSLSADISLISSMENQKNNVLNKIEMENKKYLDSSAIYSALAQIQTDAKKKDEAETFSQQYNKYKEENTRKLLDPMNIVKNQIIEKEKLRIAELKESFHARLMQADISITVEVELLD